jgi:hypothetical protein
MSPRTKLSPPITTHRRRAPRGLGLVEVLMCVSIGAMLLTAVAVAFKSSFNSYKDSQQRGQMLNSARGFMSRITADIRMCDSAAPYDPTPATNTTETSQFLSGQVPGTPTPGLLSAGGTGIIGIQLVKSHPDSWDPLASSTNKVLVTYWYDSTKEQIFMTRKMGSGAAPTPSVVCNFVQTCQFFMLPFNSPAEPLATPSPWAGGYVLQRAVVDMTLANKDANGNRILTDAGQDLTLTFSDAACPRRQYPGQTSPPL